MKSKNITPVDFGITREMREARNGHKGACIWFTGLSGSGKSTIAKALVDKLFEMGCQTKVLDGDNIRHGLCSDLGFSSEDRSENIRRIAEVAKLFVHNGTIVICAFISPFQKDRDFARSIIDEGHFFETYINCDIEVCKQRDPKGLYKKAEAGEIKGFTGIDSPYEFPVNPAINLRTDRDSVEELISSVIDKLRKSNILVQKK